MKTASPYTQILEFDRTKKQLQTVSWRLTIDRHEKPLQEIDITKEKMLIGQHSDCDIVIDDPYVSRRHCELLQQDGVLFLRDLGSTNGTFVDEMRIENINIGSGGRFSIGRTDILCSRRTNTESLRPSEQTQLGNAIGKSRVMREIFQLIEKVAPSKTTVLITGESGTGKEVVARLIHEYGLNPGGPFVPINCGALPASIIESMLFGYERGAFTGAYERSPGLFEQARDGTLFFDEIGEMPLELQARLLRVLEEKRIRRLGGNQEIDVDVRLIAATNRNLTKLVTEKRFRSDLFYRLFVVPIELPSLRKRKTDIEALAQHFVSKLAPVGRRITLHPSALEKLSTYHWPGNIRELRNTIERSLILCESDLLHADAIELIPAEIEPQQSRELESMERASIIDALIRWQGNKSRVARDLGIARSTLTTKLHKFGIDFRQYYVLKKG